MNTLCLIGCKDTANRMQYLHANHDGKLWLAPTFDDATIFGSEENAIEAMRAISPESQYIIERIAPPQEY